MALQVSGVFKSYGRGSRKVDVLRDFCMNIPRGHIYGLLGEMSETELECDVASSLSRPSLPL